MIICNGVFSYYLNTFYNEHCYMPVHLYEGLSGKLVTTILRPGRRNKQTNIARLLQKLISYLQVQWPKTKIIVRGDSHFASPLCTKLEVGRAASVLS